MVDVKKRHFAALKESKEILLKKNRRFVVTEFVKTCDELVIGYPNVCGMSDLLIQP